MREKTLKFVVTFRTTTDAMAMECCCMERELPGRLIPLPPVIDAECGMCWAAPAQAEQTVRTGMEQAGLGWDRTFLLML